MQVMGSMYLLRPSSASNVVALPVRRCVKGLYWCPGENVSVSPYMSAGSSKFCEVIPSLRIARRSAPPSSPSKCGK